MSFDSDDYSARQYQVSSIDLDTKVDELLKMVVPPTSPNQALYREMMLTVARMAEADRNRWDAKIMIHADAARNGSVVQSAGALQATS